MILLVQWFRERRQAGEGATGEVPNSMSTAP
jgi:hypothetical protein